MAAINKIKWIKTAQPASTEKSRNRRRLVWEILDKVRENGIDAVRDFSRQFDGFGGPFRVPFSTAQQALDDMGPALRAACEMAIANIRAFHVRQREMIKNREWTITSGVEAGLRFLPVDSVAVCVPSGRYPLPSAAMMTVIPAQEAGVRRIAAFSTPNADGMIYPSVLAVLALLGIEEIWALGGAQAVGAFACGAGEIEKVDFIAGQGNSYVLEAKRFVAGQVGIDSYGGPNETMIVSDGSSSPAVMATDLIAQIEHDPLAKSTFIATGELIARRLLSEVEKQLHSLTTRGVAELAWLHNGLVGVADSMEDAIAYANEAAPEHLHLAVADPRGVLEMCTAYGAAFLGSDTAEVYGDYIAGINHILPTAGSARHAGSLWVGTFLRPLTHLEMTKEAARELSRPGALIAESEGLIGHAAAFNVHARVTGG